MADEPDTDAWLPILPRTPGQHYLEAEECLRRWETADMEWTAAWGDATLAKALVHATLAASDPVRSSYHDAYTRAKGQSSEGNPHPSR